ncbi:glycosyltransferase family protein [Candidatus Pacearchaeota archaeon]|nr:glycosyltransferase family protein [Candidatus Pacearchaeota archaeon]
MSHKERAQTLHKQGRMEGAEESYVRALDEDFDDVEVLSNLGYLFMGKRAFGLAAALFRRAVTIDPKYFNGWNNLGNAYKSVNNDLQAERCYKKGKQIVGMEPGNYADIYCNLSSLYVNSTTPLKGIEFANKCLEIDPNHTDGRWNKALLCLEVGDYAQGFDLYKAGFETGIRMYREYGQDVPYWNGEPDKTVVVWGEQGIGDEIMMASMIPDIARVSKKIIFECHPRLVELFTRSFAHNLSDEHCEIVVVGTRKDAYIEWPKKHPDFNAKISVGDLGKHFRRKVSDFPATPYLVVDEKRVLHYQRKLAKLGPRLKVGISWTGGYMKTRQDYRTIPLEMWSHVLGLDADFISLQYTNDAYKAVADIEEKLDVRIHHWPSAVQAENYIETAALIEALDLVISVNTSAIHLAGALGKECWVLTPAACAWRYFTPEGSDHQPWYGSNTVIKQPELGDWSSVMDAVARNLRACIAAAEMPVTADRSVEPDIERLDYNAKVDGAVCQVCGSNLRLGACEHSKSEEVLPCG